MLRRKQYSYFLRMIVIDWYSIQQETRTLFKVASIICFVVSLVTVLDYCERKYNLVPQISTFKVKRIVQTFYYTRPKTQNNFLALLDADT